MTAFEIATGDVRGPDRDPAPLARSDVAPLAALEQALLPALHASPCVIEFSGGRDSSLLLAVALAAARRHGLPEPVAYTRRFPGVEEAEERDWQELVARHLGVREWVRRDVTTERDLLGPAAAGSLRRYGVVWPPLVHLHAFDLDVAAGGALVSGEGGDEVLGPRRLAPLRALLRRKVPPGRENAVVAGLAVAPRVVRRAAVRRRLRRGLPTPWLRPAPRRALEAAIAAEVAAEPLDWRVAVQRHPRMRAVALSLGTMRAVAADAGVRRVDPFLDAGFLAAYTSAGGRLGPLNRTAAIERFFPGLLPEAVASRRAKASFNRVVWNVHTRAFVEHWDGSGVDSELVDAEALRAVWAGEQSNAMTFALLQACWLATEGTGRSTTPGGRGTSSA